MGEADAAPQRPLTSTHEMQEGSTLASASAARSKPLCACPLGAVRLALLPSCRTALPATPMDPSSVSPPPSPGPPLRLSSVSSVSRARDTQPSPRAKPSARLSKVWHRPTPEVIPATAKVSAVACISIALTPT